MRKEWNGHDKTENDKELTPGNCIVGIGKRMPEKNESVETKEIQTVSSEEAVKSLRTGAYQSMNLLSESAQRLNRLMKTAVSDNDMDRAESGGVRPEHHRIEQAIKCASAIASTIQTQVNIGRLLKDAAKKQ